MTLMDKKFFIISWNHHHIPLKIRESLSLGRKDVKKFIRSSLQHSSILEITVLSTCNRIEFHVISQSFDEVMDVIKLTHENIMHGRFDWQEHKPEIFVDFDAFKHLCLVCSGFDSMVFGEDQIVSQVKSARKMLIESQSDVGMLDFLYENALLCSRKIRSTFSNEMKSVSVSGLVLEKVKSMGGTLGEHSLLIIGAGMSATLTAKVFKKHGVGEIFIVNRNEKSGMSLSQDVSGSFFKMNDIEKALLNCNVIVAATHSNEYLLHKLQMESVMEKRRDMRLLFDISSPRNIDPSISDIDNVCLYDLDSLKSGNLHEIKGKQVMMNSALQIIDKHFMENLDILGFHAFETEFSKLEEVSV